MSIPAIYQLLKSTNLSEVQSPPWFAKLQEAIQQMILHDFSGLVQILYRMDVCEKTLREQLAQQPHEDAAAIIARLMLERHLARLKTRQQFKCTSTLEDGEEKW